MRHMKIILTLSTKLTAIINMSLYFYDTAELAEFLAIFYEIYTKTKEKLVISVEIIYIVK